MAPADSAVQVDTNPLQGSSDTCDQEIADRLRIENAITFIDYKDEGETACGGQHSGPAQNETEFKVVKGKDGKEHAVLSV